MPRCKQRGGYIDLYGLGLCRAIWGGHMGLGNITSTTEDRREKDSGTRNGNWGYMTFSMLRFP